jgi:hypothetical protein
VLRKRGDVDCRQSIASTIRPPTLQACRRAASAAAAGQRVPSCQKGRGLQLRAWLIVGGASARLLGLKSLCVWAALAPMRAGSGSPHWHLAAVVRRLRPRCPVGGASYDGCLQWRPCGVGCVCVATPWLVREPRGWSFRGCGGGGWGAGVWWAGSRAQARGQLATVRHAHRVSTQLKPTQQASGLFLASVARKPSPALTQLAGGVCKQPVANEDAEHARFSDSRLLSRGRANCWKSVH